MWIVKLNKGIIVFWILCLFCLLRCTISWIVRILCIHATVCLAYYPVVLLDFDLFLSTTMWKSIILRILLCHSLSSQTIAVPSEQRKQRSENFARFLQKLSFLLNSYLQMGTMYLFSRGSWGRHWHWKSKSWTSHDLVKVLHFHNLASKQELQGILLNFWVKRRRDYFSWKWPLIA